MPKISELNASIALTGDELILLVQDATTVRTTINTLKTLFTQDIPDRGPIESSLTNPRRLTYSVPKERLFLVKFALDSFNFQYGTDYAYEDFDVTNAPNNQSSCCAFDVYKIDADTPFVFRLYCTFDKLNVVSSFELIEAEDGDPTSPLRYYAANAFLDTEFLYSGENYIRRHCPRLPVKIFVTPDDPPDDTLDALLTEDNHFIFTEKNDYIFVEASQH